MGERFSKEGAKRLEKWGVVRDAFDAPEVASRLVGNVGERRVSTSRIADSEDRFVRTESGSVYELGEPDPEYVAFLKGKGCAIDPDNPIKTVSRVEDLTTFKGWPS